MSSNIKKKNSIDMTQGPMLGNIIKFVIPLILGNMLQLLYNAADLIVVGRFAGSNATAAVGATGSINALFVNLCIGLSIGASVIVSRRIGAKDDAGTHRGVHTAMGLSVVSGLVGMVLGIMLAKPVLVLFGTPAGEVLDGAILYMRIFFIGLPASMVYNFGAAIMRAAGDTKRPLYILSAAGLVNVLLNLVLVIAFHMGVAGVAIATAVANYISAIAVIVCLSGTHEAYKLNIKKIKFYKAELIETLKIGVPASIQSSVFSIANMVIQGAINSFGAQAMAGSAAASNIEGFTYTGMNAFYQAALTSVSQNYGAKNEKRIYRTMWICIASVVVVGFSIGLLTTIFATPLLKIYITDSKEAIEFGIIKIYYLGLPYFLCGIMEVLAGVLRGIGHSNMGMVNSLLGACGLRLLWVQFLLPLSHTPEMLFLCWPVSWVVVILAHAGCFLAVRKHSMHVMKGQA